MKLVLRIGEIKSNLEFFEDCSRVMTLQNESFSNTLVSKEDIWKWAIQSHLERVFYFWLWTQSPTRNWKMVLGTSNFMPELKWSQLKLEFSALDLFDSKLSKQSKHSLLFKLFF